MIGHYVGDVTGSITAKRTYVTIPESARQTVVLKCGDRSVEVSWRDLFEMLSEALAARGLGVSGHDGRP